MKTSKVLSITPGTAIALVALFFALGGSAFAVGERIQSATAAQQRCTNGAVRGIAAVTGNPSAGIANVPDQFTAAGALFARKFNCTGRATQVRRTGTGVFEVRFVGNTAQSALAAGFGNTLVSVEPVPGGAFKVSLHPAGRDDFADVPFVVVVI